MPSTNQFEPEAQKVRQEIVLDYILIPIAGDLGAKHCDWFTLQWSSEGSQEVFASASATIVVADWGKRRRQPPVVEFANCGLVSDVERRPFSLDILWGGNLM